MGQDVIQGSLKEILTGLNFISNPILGLQSNERLVLMAVGLEVKRKDSCILDSHER